MNSNKYIVYSTYLCLLIVSAQVGVELLNMPYNLANHVGHDGWLSIILSFLLSVIFSFIIVRWLERFGNKSLIEINRAQFGRVIGNFFNILYIIYYASSTILGMRIFGELVQLVSLRTTPTIVISVFTIIPTLIAINDGVNTVAQMSTFLYIVMAVVMIICGMNFKYMDFYALGPVGESGVRVFKDGISYSVPVFYGVTILPAIYDKVKDKENVFKAVVCGNLVTFIFAMLIYITSVTLFGEELLSHYIIPLYCIASTVSSHIFERLDAYFIVIWFLAIAGIIRSYGYSTIVTIRKLLHLKRRRSTVYIIFAIFILLAKLPDDYIQVMSINNTLNIVSGFFIIFFCICYIISFFNKRGVEK